LQKLQGRRNDSQRWQVENAVREQPTQRNAADQHRRHTA